LGDSLNKTELHTDTVYVTGFRMAETVPGQQDFLRWKLAQ